MRVKHSWVLALLLTGCQLTQQTESDKTASPETNNPPTVTSSKPTTKPSESVESSKTVVTPQSQEDVWHRIATVSYTHLRAHET